MIISIIDFFRETLSNPYLVILIISLLPLIELRGAIPVGFAMFLAIGMPAESAILISFLIAFIGSSLILPLIYLCLEWGLKILYKVKILKKVITRIRSKFNKKANKLKAEIEEGTKDYTDLNEHTKRVNKIQFWALFTFVAIPLPLTGVYTGSAIGTFANIKLSKALFPIIIGNFVAGFLISLISLLFGIFI